MKMQKKEMISKILLGKNIPEFFSWSPRKLVAEVVDLLLLYDHVIVNVDEAEKHYKFWAYNESGISFWGKINAPNPASKEANKWDLRSKMYDKINKGGYTEVSWN